MRHAVMVPALSIACAVASASHAAPDACVARSGPGIVPLVELYTSEGCSSCPPADRWLSRRSGVDDANFLAFHVDYWDDIGWPDRFASSAHSERQRRRVHVAGSDTVYTPQVMVGTDVRARWHDASSWAGQLSRARGPARAVLALRLEPAGDAWTAHLTAAPVARGGDIDAGSRLWLARYVDDRATRVQAGENRGSTLHHDRVVVELAGPWPLGSEALARRIDLPAEAAPWGITAFVEDAGGGILQSLDLPAIACAGASATQ